MKNSIDEIFRAWNLFMRKPTGSFLIVNIDVIKTTVICFPFISPLSLSSWHPFVFCLLFTPFVYSSPFFIHHPLLISLSCVFDLAFFLLLACSFVSSSVPCSLSLFTRPDFIFSLPSSYFDLMSSLLSVFHYFLPPSLPIRWTLSQLTHSW